MTKECKNVNTVNAGKSQRNNEEWHYEFADKMIESWPSWKKEIYETNYSNSHNRKESVSYK